MQAAACMLRAAGGGSLDTPAFLEALGYSFSARGVRARLQLAPLLPPGPAICRSCHQNLDPSIRAPCLWPLRGGLLKTPRSSRRVRSEKNGVPAERLGRRDARLGVRQEASHTCPSTNPPVPGSGPVLLQRRRDQGDGDPGCAEGVAAGDRKG